MTELPQVHRVREAQRVGKGVSALWFEGRLDCEPGQFIMVWLPGVGEKPYAVSHQADDAFAITVKERGPLSTQLGELRPGAQLGLRGPYGRGFRLSERGVIVAGSVGIATVAAIKERYPAMPLLMGARTAGEVLYADRFPDMRVFTDDGSAGTKGFPTDALPALIDAGGVDAVFTCGPEVMMVAVFRICEGRGIECQASLERYMKCGFGVCGQCTCDSLLVCKDGPVFTSGTLRNLHDFGRTALLKDGAKVSVQAYAEARKEPEPESNGPVT